MHGLFYYFFSRMLGTIREGIWTFLTLYDTGDQFALLREKHLQTLAELEESQRQTEELVDAMSELIYVMRYCPTKKPMEKLANEKDLMFHPLLSTQQRRENNKRKLDLLMESLIPIRMEERARRKTRLCETCHSDKLEKCFPSSFSSKCHSCHHREQFPRNVKRKTSL